MVLACVASVAGYTLVGLSSGAGAILVAYALTSLASTPVMPLSETYALKGLAARGRAYGPVRLWGSVAFILGTFAAGFAADVMPARDLIWLIVAATILLAPPALTLRSRSPPARAGGAAGGRRRVAARSRLRRRAGAASLIQASHALFYGFSALQWRAAGFDGTTIAALWGLGVAPRSCCSRCQARLPPFFRPTVLLLVGAGGAVLALGGDGARSAAVRATISAGAARVCRLARPISARCVSGAPRAARPGATAQGYLAITLGRRWRPRRGCPAWLYDDFGSGAYVAMALAALGWRRFRADRAPGAAAKRRAERSAGASIPIAARHDAAQRAALEEDHLARQIRRGC